MKRVTVSKRRWVILISMMVTITAMQVQWLALSPVSESANEYFANQLPLLGVFNVNLLSLIYMFALFFLTVPSALLIRKVGFAWPIRVTSITIIVASILKYFFYYHLTTVFYLQLLLACCQCFIIGSFTDVAERWFAKRERGFVLGLLTLSFYIGIMIPSIFSPLFLKDGKLDIKSLYFVYALLCTILASITLIFIKPNPKHPIIDENSRRDLNIEESFKALTKSLSSIIILLIVAFSWGLFQSMLTTIGLLNKYISNQRSISLIGLLFLGGGMIGSSSLGALSDYLRKRKIIFIIANLINFIAVLLLFFFNTNIIISYISILLIGVSLLTIYPLGMQYASEFIYPVKASFTQGIILIISYAFAILFTLIIVVNARSYYSVLLVGLVILSFLSAFGSLFIKESPMVLTEDDMIDFANKEESVRRE